MAPFRYALLRPERSTAPDEDWAVCRSGLLRIMDLSLRAFVYGFVYGFLSKFRSSRSRPLFPIDHILSSSAAS